MGRLFFQIIQRPDTLGDDQVLRSTMRLACYARHKEVGTKTIEDLIKGLTTDITLTSFECSTKECHTIS